MNPKRKKLTRRHVSADEPFILVGNKHSSGFDFYGGDQADKIIDAAMSDKP